MNGLDAPMPRQNRRSVQLTCLAMVFIFGGVVGGIVAMAGFTYIGVVELTRPRRLP